MIKTSLITQNCYLLVERENSSMNGPSQIIFLWLFCASLSLISSSFHQRFNGDAIDNLEEWSNEESELAPPKINLRENAEQNNDIMDEKDDLEEGQLPIARLLRRVKDPCSKQTTHIRDLVRKVETLARNSFTVLSSLDEIYVVLEETRIEQKRIANALENHRNGIPS